MTDKNPNTPANARGQTAPVDPLWILLHASAVKTPIGAILFLGHSRAGKSTICRILSALYEPISDDTVQVSHDPERGWIAKSMGFYVRGRHRICREQMELEQLGAVPIHATMRIYQAQSTVAAALTEIEHCFHLTNGVIEGIGQSGNYSIFDALRWFPGIARMARDVRGWSLQFTKGNETIQYISKWIEDRKPVLSTKG